MKLIFKVNLWVNIMRIIRTFDLPSTKLFTVKYDWEDLDALEKLRLEWSSMEFLIDFFTKF